MSRPRVGSALAQVSRIASAAWMLASREWLAEVRHSRLSALWPLLYPLAYTALFVLLRPTLAPAQDGGLRYAAYVFIGFALWQTWIDALRLQLGAIRRYRSLVGRGELDSTAVMVTGIVSIGLQWLPRMLVMLAAAWGLTAATPAALAGLLGFSVLLLLNGAAIGGLLQPFATLAPGVDRVVQGLSLALLLTGGVFAPLPEPRGPVVALLTALNPMGVLLDAARTPLFGEAPVRWLPVAAWSLLTLAALVACTVLGRRLLPIVTERLGN